MLQVEVSEKWNPKSEKWNTRRPWVRKLNIRAEYVESWGEALEAVTASAGASDYSAFLCDIMPEGQGGLTLFLKFSALNYFNPFVAGCRRLFQNPMKLSHFRIQRCSCEAEFKLKNAEIKMLRLS